MLHQKTCGLFRTFLSRSFSNTCILRTSNSISDKIFKTTDFKPLRRHSTLLKKQSSQYSFPFSRLHSTNESLNDEADACPEAERVKITYIDRDGETHDINAKVGDNVMYLAQKHDLDVEGACEASLACCTCHVYVENHFDKLSEIDEEEEDMLDLAPFLQENSRLSCQIILSKELDGIVVRIPSATRNFYVDGHKPKPH
uniref:adrenodoxin-like protein, mitochondrial n=1 Tax=Ciona intestinalis TaxID=7719 RepID=UPI000180C6F0|nr:adrenodoxin-like protein, mitochondrial [Ciona intestinalis]|eukprot:XP_002131140.1 adrenodoxin-like protein, mitochondrial [Ciona intestinalis]